MGGAFDRDISVSILGSFTAPISFDLAYGDDYGRDIEVRSNLTLDQAIELKQALAEAVREHLRRA
jgi:hypothetical protein